MGNMKLTKRTFPVLGMSCAGCSARVEKTLNKQEGVASAAVNLAAATAMVEYDEAVCTAEMLQTALQRVGFDLIVEQDEAVAAEEADEAQADSYWRLKQQTLWAAVLALPVAVIGMFFMDAPGAGYAMWLLSTPVVFWFGRGFFMKAFSLLRRGMANMDTLVAASTGIAYGYSLCALLFPSFWHSGGIVPHVYFESSAVVIAFILAGRLLEARAKGNTSAAIRRLMGLQPKTVTRINADGGMETVEIGTVRRGDVLLAKPGERVAVDGVVTEGASYVDESMLSGEPLPVEKSADAPVCAGTFNQKGTFCYRAEKVGRDTMLAHIVRMVQEAQGSKAPVQQLADRIAAVFVPAVMSIALLTFAGWLFLAPADGFSHGLQAAVTVLVIACPCALGLATPTAIMVGIGKGAEAGILIKNAESLQTARHIDTVVVDKTGTVTVGHPAVTDAVWLEKSQETADAVCSLERLSEHPLAEAVVTCIRHTPLKVSGFENHPGAGVRGIVGGKTFLVGNSRLMRQYAVGMDPGLEARAEALAAQGKTLVWVAADGKTAGLMAIADAVKSTSREAMARLKRMGIDVWMLTGDIESTAKAVAEEAGIGHYAAGMQPAEKADFVRELQAKGRKVAMVGDGINDSAALAAADIGIAMGQGSDIAMDVAGMTIMSSDLRRVADALRLSVLTVRTVRQNLFWAFIYNLIGIPLAAGLLYPVCGILLNPMIAGAAMAMSSVSVVLNSLRLRYKRL